MKVLMVHKTYKGGVAVHVKEISKELKMRGIKVDEITRNEDLKLKNFRKSYFKMKTLFKKWSREYDIIHTHDWSITYPALKANTKNLVSTFHAFPTNIVAKFLQNYCIKELKWRAIVVSPSMQQVYRNSSYIPNGVNLKTFKSVKKIKRRKNLIGLAQKYNFKKITKLLKKIDLKFVYTGGKWKFGKLSRFYSMLDVFISIPYKEAGFNLVWLEAMACEVPFVIGTNAGIGKILPIYKVENFNELKKILKKIKDNKLKPLKNQRQWILKNDFVWSKSVNKLLKIYRRIE